MRTHHFFAVISRLLVCLFALTAGSPRVEADEKFAGLIRARAVQTHSTGGPPALRFFEGPQPPETQTDDNYHEWRVSTALTLTTPLALEGALYDNGTDFDWRFDFADFPECRLEGVFEGLVIQDARKPNQPIPFAWDLFASIHHPATISHVAFSVTGAGNSSMQTGSATAPATHCTNFQPHASFLTLAMDVAIILDGARHTILGRGNSYVVEVAPGRWLTAITGDVELVTPSGGRFDLQPGDLPLRVEPKSRIITGLGASATLRLLEEKAYPGRVEATDYSFATVNIVELSDVALEELVKGEFNVRLRLFLKAGAVAAEVNPPGNTAPKSDFSVRTPVATIGVRGTTLVVGHQGPESPQGEKTAVLMHEGGPAIVDPKSGPPVSLSTPDFIDVTRAGISGSFRETPPPVIEGYRLAKILDLGHPGGLALRPNGELLVADRGFGKILRVTPASTDVQDFAELPPGFEDFLLGPVLLPDGRAVVANSATGKIFAISQNGAVAPLGAGVLPHISGLALRPDGKLLATTTNPGVHTIDSNGVVAGLIDGLGAPALPAVLDDGRMFFEDQGAVTALAGDPLEPTALASVANLTLLHGFGSLGLVAAQAPVDEFSAGKLLRIDTGTGEVAEFGRRFSKIVGLAGDPDGTFYLSDANDRAIYRAEKIAPGTPAIATGARALGFGNVIVNSTSRRSVTVVNIGTADLTLTGASSTHAAFAAVGSFPRTIAPGDETRVDIDFTPAAGGSFSEKINLQSDDPATPVFAVAVIAGQGMPGAAILSGTQTVGTVGEAGAPAVYTVVLSNTGTLNQPDNPGDEFRETLPAGLQLVSASASAGTAVATPGTNTVAWNGAVPAGGSVTITIQATIDPAAAIGTEISATGTLFVDKTHSGSNDSKEETTSATFTVRDFAAESADEAYLFGKFINIDVLANDDAGDLDVNVTGRTDGQHGTVAINADGTLRYTPTPGATFPPAGDAFTYTVSDGLGGSFTIAVTVQSAVEAVGTFNGLVAPAAGTAPRNEALGIVKLTIGKTGAFSGSLSLAGAKFTLRGVLDPAGVARFGRARAADLIVKRKAPARQPAPPLLMLRFHLGENERISGSLTQLGAPFAAFEAERAFYSSKNPVAAPVLGKYTVLFSPVAAPNNGLDAARFPQGTGFGLLTVAAKGTAKLSGTLADGTAVSSANSLSEDNGWPIYVSFYKKNGALSGLARFRTLAATDLDGLGLTWIRPANVPPLTRYPPGWLDPGILVDLIGSKFVGPQRGVNVSILPGLDPVSPAGNADFLLRDGNLPVPGAIDVSANVDTKNKIVLLAAPAALKLKLKLASSGIVTGSFVHPATNKSTPIKGALFQKQNRAAGFFPGPAESGEMRLVPKP